MCLFVWKRQQTLPYIYSLLLKILLYDDSYTYLYTYWYMYVCIYLYIVKHAIRPVQVTIGILCRGCGDGMGGWLELVSKISYGSDARQNKNKRQLCIIYKRRATATLSC